MMREEYMASRPIETLEEVRRRRQGKKLSQLSQFLAHPSLT
jgi:hypothetical protein